MRKALVLGAFGFREKQFGGQTNKTKNLLYLMQKHGLEPVCFDTQDIQYNKLLFLSMLWKVMRCNKLYYLPAHNSLKYLFPLIYLLTKFTNTSIHYFVVGGWLKEFLEDLPWHRKKLAKISGIHCETNLMKRLLEQEFGFGNVDVFPNFRITDYKPTKHHEDNKLKLVFMARILKMKGLDTIFNLCELVSAHGFSNQITIDFYGPLENEGDDTNYFNSNIEKYNFVKYNGPAEPSEIYKILEQYDVMLLPTHFYTEGLPGSVVDAYMSGIPVIVTKWKHATEFVDDGQTGFIIPFEDNGKALYEAVMKFYNDTELLNRQKDTALKKSYDFTEEKAWELFKQYI